MNFSGCQKLTPKNLSDLEKPDGLTSPNGEDGWKEKKKMEKSKPLTPKEFVSKMEEFLKETHSSPHAKTLPPEQIIDAFRLWWMDYREQEAVAEARAVDDRFGLNEDLFGD